MTAHEKKLSKLASFYEHIVPPAAPEETHFRHSHWQARRSLILKYLREQNTGIITINRFEECGSGCVIEWSEELQRHRIAASYCHSRHCEPCMRAKGNKIAANLRTRIQDDTNNTYRFITLTLRHRDAPLRNQIERLYASFKKLRASKEWKNSQTGGAAILEVKWNTDTNTWHPHLHVISAGNFLDKHDLSRLWHRATGDSFIVDIKAMKNSADVCHYVSKYVAKGTSPTVWESAETAHEWICASKGVRTCATFGTWRGYALTANHQTAKDWKPIASYVSILAAARRAELWAIGILQSICPSEDPEEIRCKYVMDTGDG